MSTVGAVGALTGHTVSAYLTDRETLGENGMTAGSVTLSLDGVDTGRTALGFVVNDYGYANRDERTVCLGLDDVSNQGGGGVRACPPGTSGTGALRARLTVDGATLFSGTLAGLLTSLDGGDGGGVLLSSDGEPVRFSESEMASATPLTPGEDGAVCLTVAVWAPTDLREDPDTVRALKAASPFPVALDVYAEQSRHVPAPRRPIDGTNPAFEFPPCPESEGGGGADDTDLGHAISHISLCTDAAVDGASVTWVVRDPATDADVTGDVSEPFVVDVTSPVPINYAVVKGGSSASPAGGFRRVEAGGATTVRVTSTGGTLLDVPNNFGSCACEGLGVKIDWNDANDDFDAPETLSCDDHESTGDRSNGNTEEDDDGGQSNGNENGNGNENANGKNNSNGGRGGRSPTPQNGANR
jgi:hypothetical protein